MVSTLVFHTDRMAALAPQGFALATDIAEWLVRAGVPFRDAHEIAGGCVRRCEQRAAAEDTPVELWDLTDADLTAVSPLLTPQVRDVLTTTGSLTSRNGRGGTAPTQVAAQHTELLTTLESLRKLLPPHVGQHRLSA